MWGVPGQRLRFACGTPMGHAFESRFSEEPPQHVRDDLPGGGRRLIARAEGVAATIVAGRTVCLDGQYTDERPGRVLRSGAVQTRG